MSLTLRSVPQELMPTYNPVIIVATSSLQNRLNYQLVTDVYCRGEMVTRMKTPVNPEGYIIVDLHKHLENRVSFDFMPGATGWNIATQSFASYSVTFYDEFREEWDFSDNIYQLVGATAYVGFIGPTGGVRPYFNTGDYIYVSQNVGYAHPEYNGAHYVTAVTQSGSRWIVRTDNYWVSSSPVNPGYITFADYQLTTTASGTLTIYSTPTQSSTASVFPTKYIFNGVVDYLGFINWNYDDWDANTTTNGKFFTNAPSGYEIDINSHLFLNTYQNAINEIKYLKIKTNLGTYSVTNPYLFSSTSLTQRRFMQVNGSPKDLYNLGWINNSTKTIEVWCEDNTGAKTVASKIFTITDKCSKYDKMEIIFMDKMGSFIPYTFNLVNRETRNISRTDYQQFYGSYAPATQNWKYNTWDRGRKSLDTVVTQQFTLNSDWVNQSTSDYLMELFESPEAYWTKPDGTILAVNITVQSIERKQVINDQLINYVLTFELSQKSSSQRG